MVNEVGLISREFTEYRTLVTVFEELYGKFCRKRSILRVLIEETAARKKEVLMALEKANRLTLRLTVGQRQVTGISYHLNEIKTRINQVNQSSPVLFNDTVGESEIPREIRFEFKTENPDYSRIRKELKEKCLLILGFIDRFKKQILQMEILEMRCRELIASIKKALKAFYYESGAIRRKIYPFGIFSFFRRIIGCFFGRSYFSSRDLNEIRALGCITGYVMNIADSAVF